MKIPRLKKEQRQWVTYWSTLVPLFIGVPITVVGFLNPEASLLLIGPAFILLGLALGFGVNRVLRRHPAQV